jgi:hypothetical protein
MGFHNFTGLFHRINCSSQRQQMTNVKGKSMKYKLIEREQFVLISQTNRDICISILHLCQKFYVDCFETCLSQNAELGRYQERHENWE